jgi:hypothetical protein
MMVTRSDDIWEMKVLVATTLRPVLLLIDKSKLLFNTSAVIEQNDYDEINFFF